MVTETRVRRGRACLPCKKLKVKCMDPERTCGCRRCERLGIDCKLPKVVAPDAESTAPSLAMLERSVRAILAKLEMPSLESFSLATDLQSEFSGAIRESAGETENSPESNIIADVPMEGLYEATRLIALRTSSGQGTAGVDVMNYLKSDLVAEGLINREAAEDLLDMFKKSLSRYLYDIIISTERTLQSIREASTLFFTAIMTVTSLHVAGMEETHKRCTRKLRELIASHWFSHSHSLDDLRGLCIAAFWLPDLSWKLSGYCVRVGTELNLHKAFFNAFCSQNQGLKDRDLVIEHARLWYLVYVLDHHFSIAYGRPPGTTELQAIRDTQKFLQAKECSISDRRLISQVALFRILSKAYDFFGLEPGRLLQDDDETLLMHASFMQELDTYRDTFRPLLHVDEFVGTYSISGIDLHYHFNSMMLNSLALRGRPMEVIKSLPHRLRPMALRAIESAHRILEMILHERDLQTSLVGVPLYLHAMIAFAAVFLIKMSSIWHIIGVTISVQTRTWPLLRKIITTMRSCETGATHILYQMATGFEKLVKQMEAITEFSKGENFSPTSKQPSSSTHPISSAPGIPTSQQYSALSSDFHILINEFDNTSSTFIGPSSAVDDLSLRDGLFWNTFGLEYDLLANEAEGAWSFPYTATNFTPR